MLEDFKRALARVQSDYGFYIACQTNPVVALEGYALSPDERTALSDPEKLTDLFRRGPEMSPLRLTVTISGKHDWVNRTRPKKTTMAQVDLDARVATEVETIKHARTGDQRSPAVLRLMELIG
jgi:hypothetical protein